MKLYVYLSMTALLAVLSWGKGWFIIFFIIGLLPITVAVFDGKKNKILIGAWIISLPAQWNLLADVWVIRPSIQYSSSYLVPFHKWVCDLSRSYFSQDTRQDAWQVFIPDLYWTFTLGVEPIFCLNPCWLNNSPLWGTHEVLSEDFFPSEYSEKWAWFQSYAYKSRIKYGISDHYLFGALEMLKTSCLECVQSGKCKSFMECMGENICEPCKKDSQCCDCGCLTKEEEDNLLKAFSPVLYFVGKNDPPQSADMYYNSCSIEIRHLKDNSTENYLTSKSLQHILTEPQVYGRFIPRGSNSAICQYWFFWDVNDFRPTNEFSDYHEGDWEVFTISIKRNNSNDDWSLEWVSGSQHLWAYTQTMPDIATTDKKRTKIVVGQGSHSLFLPGEIHWMCAIENVTQENNWYKLSEYNIDRIEGKIWNNPGLRWGSSKLQCCNNGLHIIEDSPLSPADLSRITWKDPIELSTKDIHPLECSSTYGQVLCILCQQGNLDQIAGSLYDNGLRPAADVGLEVASNTVVYGPVCAIPSSIGGVIEAGLSIPQCVQAIELGPPGLVTCEAIAEVMGNAIAFTVCSNFIKLTVPKVEDVRQGLIISGKQYRNQTIVNISIILKRAMTCANPN